MKKIIPLLLLIVFYSCDQVPANEKFDKKTVENKYSISVPENLGVTTELNKEASLQLQNPLDEFYVIVIDESSSDFVNAIENNLLNATPDLDGYYNATLSHLKKLILRILKYTISRKRKLILQMLLCFQSLDQATVLIFFTDLQLYREKKDIIKLCHGQSREKKNNIPKG